MYHLAVTYLDQDKRQVEIPLLSRAAADGDYPEASAVMVQIRQGQDVNPCRCRRHIRKELGGHAQCALHPRGSRAQVVRGTKGPTQ